MNPDIGVTRLLDSCSCCCCWLLLLLCPTEGRNAVEPGAETDPNIGVEAVEVFLLLASLTDPDDGNLLLSLVAVAEEVLLTFGGATLLTLLLVVVVVKVAAAAVAPFDCCLKFDNDEVDKTSAELLLLSRDFALLLVEF